MANRKQPKRSVKLVSKRVSNRGWLVCSIILTMVGFVLLIITICTGTSPTFLPSAYIVSIKQSGRTDSAYVLKECTGPAEVNTCSALKVSSFDADIGFPSVKEHFYNRRRTFWGMFACYVLGSALSVVTVVMCFLGTLLVKSRSVGAATMFLCLFSCLLVGAASGIATSLSYKTVDVVKQVQFTGLTALPGKTFLGMSWTVTVLFLFAFFIWLKDYIRRKRA